MPIKTDDDLLKMPIRKKFKGKRDVYESWECSCCSMSGSHRLSPGSTVWRCVACGKACTPHMGEMNRPEYMGG